MSRQGHLGSKQSRLWWLVCVLTALAAQAWAVQPARADVNGFGSDESLQTAPGPLDEGIAYTGAFSSAQDIDYLYFEVPRAQTLRFDMANTLEGCKPYWIEPSASGEARLLEPFPTCPMWATLVDSNGQQLGGEGSAAGSGPIEYASYEYIEWTFVAAGRYYLVLESDYCGGHPSECQLPTFKLSYAVPPPQPSGGAGGGGVTGGGGTGGSGAGSGSKTGSGTGTKTGSGAGSTGGQPSGLQSGQVGVVEGKGAGSFTVSGSPALIERLVLAKRQRGARVKVTLVSSQRLANLDLRLLARVGPRHRLTVVGHRVRRHPLAGREQIQLQVKASGWLSSKRYTPVLLRVRALAPDGAAELIQGRLLLRR